MSSYDICPFMAYFTQHIFKVHPSHDTYQNSIPLNVYTHILFIHSLSMDICFPFGLLWIMLLWTWVYRYLFETQFSILLGSYQKWNWWIIWSYGNSMFNILRNCPDFFYSDWTILHFHWQCMRVLISLYACSHLVFSVFLLFYFFKWA